MSTRSQRVPLTLFFAFLAATLALAARQAKAQDTILWDFESGELAPWKIVEGENSKPIGSRDVEFHNNSTPYQKSGKFYLTTLESSRDDAPTDDVRCVIESPVFRIEGDAIRFLVGGAGKRDDVRVELALLDDDEGPSDELAGELAAGGRVRAHGHCSHVLARVCRVEES